MNNELEAIFFLKYVGNHSFQQKKKKISHCHFSALYQIYLYSKNVDRGKWLDIHTCKETIAKHSGISRASVTRFLVSPESRNLLDIKRGKTIKGMQAVNRYKIKDPILKAFRFLESKGFFKNYKKTSNSIWRNGFNNRLEKWLIPLLEKGLSFEQILKGDLNILSTKNELKRAAEKNLKRAGTTLPPEDSFYNTKELEKGKSASPSPRFYLNQEIIQRKKEAYTTERDHEKLKIILGSDEKVNACYEKLSNYRQWKGISSNKNKSDFWEIQHWVIKAIEETYENIKIYDEKLIKSNELSVQFGEVSTQWDHLPRENTPLTIRFPDPKPQDMRQTGNLKMRVNGVYLS